MDNHLKLNIIDDIPFFENPSYQYRLQLITVGQEQKPFITILRKYNQTSTPVTFIGSSNYISIPLIAFFKLQKTISHVNKFIDIGKIQPVKEVGFEILNFLKFYETDLSQFRIQAIRTGLTHNLAVSIIEFYKNNKADLEFKPSQKFISLPLPAWEKFVESISKFQTLIETKFKSQPKRSRSLSAIKNAEKRNNCATHDDQSGNFTLIDCGDTILKLILLL